jgi:endoglucanase
VVRVPDNKTVLTGLLTEPVLNADTNEQLAVADFSAVTEPGQYRIEVAGLRRSPSFRVAPDVYNQPFRVVMGGMYLWRCGTAVSLTYNGNTFAHDACHLEDAYLDFVGGGHVRRESTKGWHDAGDFNKYVVNAGFTVGVMLQAWEQFKPRIEKVRLAIPESGNGTPDYLSEVRWELEWLLTMQMEDGRVYHKVSATRFCGFIMPERETADRYFVPWSSAATADLAATMAMAARDYEPFDKPFARRCLNAARKSYAYLAAHPADHQADQHGFSTGGYPARDPSRRLWAAVELWQTTGEPGFLKDFESRASKLDHKVDRTCGWGNITNLAMYTYLLSSRPGRDAQLVSTVRTDLLSTADAIVKTRDAHGYARPLGTAYYWGCNGDVAQQVQTLVVAHALSPKPAYLDASRDALNHLFGRNDYGRSMVTGLGHDPPMHPHDRRSAADHVVDPWPGYLVGGGWPKATDWKDEQANYRVNEIAINWNATLIYALASCVETGSGQSH